MTRLPFEARPAWQRVVLAIGAFLLIFQLSKVLSRAAVPWCYGLIPKASSSLLIQDLLTPWVLAPVQVITVLLACLALNILGIRAGWSWFVSRNRDGIWWGAAAAGGGATLIWLVLMGVGAVSVGRNPEFTWWGLPVYFQWVLFQSAGEEMFSRGLYLNLFRTAFTRAWAVWIQALLFGARHYFAYRHAPFLAASGEGPFWMMVANTTLLGVLCGFAALRWGNLWAPIAIHFVWNWTSSTLTGLPCSGSLPMPGPFVTKPLGDAQWLHGGLIGMEGSVVGFLVLLALSTWVGLRWRADSSAQLDEDLA